jgi:quercetin dioxygenase-like cupin family protein
MSKLEVKSTNVPEETRTFEKGRIELVKVGGTTIGRAVFQPGWRWSIHVKPIAKTNSCQATHLWQEVSGTLSLRMDDGTEREVKAGEIALIPPGHDGWVVGNEPVVAFDFQGLVDYGKKK